MNLFSITAMHKTVCIVLLISICSCKKKHHDDPAPVNTYKGPKVQSMHNVHLYNQFVSSNNLFAIKDSVFVTDKSSDFDLCYSNISINSKNYYVIGSPADKTYTDKAYPGLSSANATAFYKVPVSFTYADFDTLVYGSNLKSFVDAQCTIIYSNSNIQLAQAVCSEDSYGWGPNTVLAFKTKAGKYGMIRILETPTGSATESDPLKKVGLLKLDIKIQS
ncbi:MAG: hypothetical protein H7259_00930 [Cytophagales bacterium]|nr:hypothetical protein [Cytophaga sp.]